MMVPRVGYLPAYVDQVVGHFEECAPPGPQGRTSVWYEYKGIPLKWCVGVCIHVRSKKVSPFGCAIN